MNSLNQPQMIECINAAFPTAKAVEMERFNGSTTGIWIRGSEEMDVDDLPLLDPFGMDTREVTYRLGVHKKFSNFCEQVGWYCELYDAGTLMVYPS